VIQVDLHLRGLPQGGACLANHLRTDIDGVDITEDPAERNSHPACTAADLDHSHFGGLPAVADLFEVLFEEAAQFSSAGAEERIICPLLLPCRDIVPCILSRARGPFTPHLFEQSSIAHQTD